MYVCTYIILQVNFIHMNERKDREAKVTRFSHARTAMKFAKQSALQNLGPCFPFYYEDKTTGMFSNKRLSLK